MYCALCNQNKKPKIEVLGLEMCNSCMEELSSTPVIGTKYDYYKEVIKIALRNYIYERVEINPVK